MATEHRELFEKLGKEFDPSEVKRRRQGNGWLSYITARSVMNRLDEVFGPENWWAEYGTNDAHSAWCRLTVRLPSGQTVTKMDVGGRAGMQDKGDDAKSAFSDALKRAAAAFGVGRYLYNDGVPDFGDDSEVEPGNVSTPAPPGRRESAPPPSNSGQGGDPRSGRALFAWTKEMEQKYEIGLLKYLNGWAKLQDYPGRMVDWDNDQVAHALKECRRKLAALDKSKLAALDKSVGDLPADANDYATPAPTKQEPAPATSAYIPDDRNPVPPPKDGRDLYLHLNRLQDQHGCTLISEVHKWCDGVGLPRELAKLQPDDLIDTWRAAGTILARFQAKRAKLVDAAARLRNECRDACRDYLGVVQGGPDRLTDAEIAREIEGLHASEFDGEAIADWSAYSDVARLQQMIRTFGQLKEDAANVPAGI